MPPTGMLGALAVQHVLVLSIFLASPVAIARAVALASNGGRRSDLDDHDRTGHCHRSFKSGDGAVGSGLLESSRRPQSADLPGCIIAARHGGLPMMAGLLDHFIASGNRRLALSTSPARRPVGRTIGTYRADHRPEHCTDRHERGRGQHGGGRWSRWLAPLLVAVLTLGVMVGRQAFWGRGPVRTLGAIAGLGSADMPAVWRRAWWIVRLWI